MDQKKMEEIKGIIETSGNNFHYKVVDYLRKDGWVVEVSPYYHDNYANKPREIDVIAEKAYQVGGVGGSYGNINVRLFVECKYLKDDIIFWFDNKDKKKALGRILQDTPLEDPNKWTMTREHRYLKDVRVAKLFSSSKGNFENDIIYKALTQSLHAMIYNKGTPSLMTTKRRGADNCLARIDYPIIVCNSFSSVYKHDVVTKEDPKLIDDNFQMEINYAYYDHRQEPKNDYFLIDVTEYDRMSDLIKEIEESDLNAIKKKLAFERDSK